MSLTDQFPTPPLVADHASDGSDFLSGLNSGLLDGLCLRASHFPRNRAQDTTCGRVSLCKSGATFPAGQCALFCLSQSVLNSQAGGPMLPRGSPGLCSARPLPPPTNVRMGAVAWGTICCVLLSEEGLRPENFLIPPGTRKRSEVGRQFSSFQEQVWKAGFLFGSPCWRSRAPRVSGWQRGKEGPTGTVNFQSSLLEPGLLRLTRSPPDMFWGRGLTA